MPIYIDDKHVITTEELDGEFRYSLLDENDAEVCSVNAGSAYTSSEESLIAFGKRLLAEYETEGSDEKI